jgi:hypothetical protein
MRVLILLAGSSSFINCINLSRLCGLGAAMQKALTGKSRLRLDWALAAFKKIKTGSKKSRDFF